jgi:hypothetical protein
MHASGSPQVSLLQKAGTSMSCTAWLFGCMDGMECTAACICRTPTEAATGCRQEGNGEAGSGAAAAAAGLRPLAVSLLCGMAHSTQRTRAELWAQSGLDLLLGLLREQVRPALAALGWEPLFLLGSAHQWECCGTPALSAIRCILHTLGHGHEQGEAEGRGQCCLCALLAIASMGL